MEKHFVSLLFLLALMVPVISNGQDKNGTDENFHLYLLVGQSNMAGRGHLDSISEIENPTIKALNKENEWVTAKDPIHFDKRNAAVGPGISFAEAMLGYSKKKDITIGLIPAAVGGTSMDKWERGAYDEETDTHPYDDAIRRAKAAMQAGQLKGIIWHQGSSDVAPEKRDVYLERIADLIERFRKDLGEPNLPFVAGELGYHTNARMAFNKVLLRLPGWVKNTKVVKADGVNTIEDNIHFDSPSQRIMGKRYAEAINSLLLQK